MLPASRKKVHIYHTNVYFQAQNHQKYTFFPLKTLSLQRGPSEGLSAYRLKPDISCNFWALNPRKPSFFPPGLKSPKIHIFPLKTLSLQRGPSEGLSAHRLKTRHKLPLLGENTHFPGKCCPRPGKKCTFTTKMCISRPQMPKSTHFPIE